jgi:hypothetical protein
MLVVLRKFCSEEEGDEGVDVQNDDVEEEEGKEDEEEERGGVISWTKKSDSMGDGPSLVYVNF